MAAEPAQMWNNTNTSWRRSKQTLYSKHDTQIVRSSRSLPSCEGGISTVQRWIRLPSAFFITHKKHTSKFRLVSAGRVAMVLPCWEEQGTREIYFTITSCLTAKIFDHKTFLSSLTTTFTTNIVCCHSYWNTVVEKRFSNSLKIILLLLWNVTYPIDILEIYFLCYKGCGCIKKIRIITKGFFPLKTGSKCKSSTLHQHQYVVKTNK